LQLKQGLFGGCLKIHSSTTFSEQVGQACWISALDWLRQYFGTTAPIWGQPASATAKSHEIRTETLISIARINAGERTLSDYLDGSRS